MRRWSSWLYPSALLLIAVITHRRWFDFFSVLNNSDWRYWTDEAVRQMHHAYGAWISFWGFGSVNIQLTFNLFTSVWSFLVNSGLSYDSVAKLTVLIPIAVLGFISPYVLVKKLVKSESIAFVAALFYGTSSYFLVRQTAHLPVAFVGACAPLILYLFMTALERNRRADWAAFTLVFFVNVCYEVRIAFILALVLAAYFIVFHFSDLRKLWKSIGWCVLVFAGLNMFWLLPTFLGGLSAQVGEVANRGLFGNELFDIAHAFVLSDSAWTGGPLNADFVKQGIHWYFWIIPIAAFSVLLQGRGTKRKKEILFFASVSLVGIFLTKQSAMPFPNAYAWLYSHLPGFNLFREASKFFLITGLGYAALIGYGLVAIKEHLGGRFRDFAFRCVWAAVAFVSLGNAWPLMNGAIGTMFVPRHMPQDYSVLAKLLKSEAGYYRTLWLPSYPQWAPFDISKPKVSAADALDGGWKDVLTSDFSSDEPIQDRLLDFIGLDSVRSILDVSSIKYIVVPLQDKENDDDVFRFYGGDGNHDLRQRYLDGLDKIGWLDRIDIGAKDLAIYENKNFRDHLYLTAEQESIHKNLSAENVSYKSVNPTEYKISLKNIKDDAYLNFSEQYHPDWNLHIGGFNWPGVLTDKNYFLDNKYHFKNDVGLNSFLISPSYIKENFSKFNDYKENPDSSIDIELTLYFKPQSYFYLGVMISGTTLLVCLGCLGWKTLRRRKKS